MLGHHTLPITVVQYIAELHSRQLHKAPCTPNHRTVNNCMGVGACSWTMWYIQHSYNILHYTLHCASTLMIPREVKTNSMTVHVALLIISQYIFEKYHSLVTSCFSYKYSQLLIHITREDFVKIVAIPFWTQTLRRTK